MTTRKLPTDPWKISAASDPVYSRGYSSAGIRELSQSLGEFQLRKPRATPLSSSPSVESLFPAPRKRLGFFTVVSFPEADGLTPPFPVIATDRKQTGPRCSRLYRLSSARFLTSKIDRDFDVRKAAPRRRARPIFRNRFGLRDVVHSARVMNEASRVNLSVVRANIIA